MVGMYVFIPKPTATNRSHTYIHSNVPSNISSVWCKRHISYMDTFAVVCYFKSFKKRNVTKPVTSSS